MNLNQVLNYKKNLPNFIIQKTEKFASSKDDKPGVGEYDINDAKIKLKKKTGISTVRETGR